MKGNFFKTGVLVLGLGLITLVASSCVAYRSYYPDDGFRGGGSYYGETYWFVPFPFFYYWEDGRPHHYHRPPPYHHPHPGHRPRR